MKQVDIEFVNIQSHEHTKFQLRPGLNFILADDNNVGKSTIFKVITCAMQLPNVPSADLAELVRGGTRNAMAAFTVEDTTYIFWIFCEPGRAAHAFFEIKTPDGTTTRSMSAPAELRSALDIVTSPDGHMVNFIDADSVQLVVQDTPKNDEVLSQVLIDLRVDNIKANIVRLNQQIQQDYRMVKSKYDDTTHLLSTLHYVDTVDAFKDENVTLSAACRVADAIEELCSVLTDLPLIPEQLNVSALKRALQVYEGLSSLEAERSPILDAISPDLFVHFNACLEMLTRLECARDSLSTPAPKIKAKQLANAKIGLAVLDRLQKAWGSLRFADSALQEIQTLAKERESVLSELQSKTQRVTCPIRGEVFYSDEKCVPCSD